MANVKFEGLACARTDTVREYNSVAGEDEIVSAAAACLTQPSKLHQAGGQPLLEVYDTLAVHSVHHYRYRHHLGAK